MVLHFTPEYHVISLHQTVSNGGLVIGILTAMLRNEVGWFDKEENSPEVLSIRLGHDAAYVRATFSNRLSVFVQDVAAILVALALALILQWRFGLLALATIPLLVFASITQVHSVFHLESRLVN